MPEIRPSREYAEALQTRLHKGIPEGVRLEIERRKREGIPYYIARNGVVEIVMPDGSIHPVERRPGSPLSQPPTLK